MNCLSLTAVSLHAKFLKLTLKAGSPLDLIVKVARLFNKVAHRLGPSRLCNRRAGILKDWDAEAISDSLPLMTLIIRLHMDTNVKAAVVSLPVLIRRSMMSAACVGFSEMKRSVTASSEELSKGDLIDSFIAPSAIGRILREHSIVPTRHGHRATFWVLSKIARIRLEKLKQNLFGAGIQVSKYVTLRNHLSHNRGRRLVDNSGRNDIVHEAKIFFRRESGTTLCREESSYGSQMNIATKDGGSYRVRRAHCLDPLN